MESREFKRGSPPPNDVDEHDFDLNSDSGDASSIEFESKPKSHDNENLKPVPFNQADEPPYSPGRRLPLLDDTTGLEMRQSSKEAPVTWMSLPHKRQLMVLTLARLSEPLVQTSLQVRITKSIKFDIPVLLMPRKINSLICFIN